MNNSKSITDLHPDLQHLCAQWLDNCHAAFLDVRITHTFRLPEYQDFLYSQGRTLPGKKVTNATSKKSKHCFTLDGKKPAAKAFDFGVFSKGVYIQDGGDERYLKAGIIGEKLGLIWGGRFKGLVDAGHLEIK